MARPDPHRRIDMLASLMDELLYELARNADALDLSLRTLQDIEANLTDLREDRLP